MKYVAIVPKARNAGDGKTDVWITTVDLVKMIVRNGKTLNTGVNVIIAKKISDICDEIIVEAREKLTKDSTQIVLKSKFIAFEDNHYEMFKRDLSDFNFQSFALVGYSFADDVESMINPKNKLGEDEKGELVIDLVRKKTTE